MRWRSGGGCGQEAAFPARRDQALLGFATDVGGQVLVTVLTFATTPLILGMTSKSQYGAWQAVLSLIAYLGLLDFGLGVAVVRTIAALPPGIGKGQFNRVASSAFFSFCCISVVFLAVGWWFSSSVPVWFAMPERDGPAITSAYRVAAVAAALGFPASTFGAVLTGMQRMAMANAIKAAGSLIGLGVCVALLFAGIGVVALALSNLVAVLFTAVLSYWLAKKNFSELHIHPALIDKHSLSEIWKFGGYFQLARIANTVALSTDALVIASRLSAAAVTPYALSSKAAVLASTTLASKIPGALFPGLSSMFGQSENAKLRRVLCLVLRLSTRLACIGAFLVAVCNERFVSLWVGHGVYGGSTLNRVFVFWVAQDTILRGLSAFVYASGQMRGWAMMCTIEALVNIGVSLTLVAPLGIVGVALGTSVARTITTFWLFWWLCMRLSLRPNDLLGTIMKPVLRCIPGCVLGWSIARMLPESLGWWWLVSVTAVTCMANLASFEGWNFIQARGMPFDKRIAAAALAELRY